jgi:hypothetical protein
MGNAVYMLTLAASVAVLWFQVTRMIDAISIVCNRCGDIVQLQPMWPTPCPHCKHILVG